MKRLLIPISLALITGCADADRAKWDSFWAQGQGGGGSLFDPKGGEKEFWTIECNEYRGPSAREMADRMATALKKVDQLRGKEIWTEDDEKRSRVFCGTYHLRFAPRKTDDDKTVPGDTVIELNDEIKRDLEFIRSLAIGDKHPFFSARAIPKPLEDVGPPEWDLRNAKGVYTLNVGVTYNTPTLHNYKEAAVEWVKDLRQRGYEAYYYHDPVKPCSSICVGTFGEDALILTKDGPHYSEVVKRLQEKEELKWNLENGVKTFRAATGPDGKRAKMANESFLAKIPQPNLAGSSPPSN